MHSFINWIGCVAHPWIGNWEWEFFPCSVAAAAAAAAVVVAVAAVAVAVQPTAVSTNSCLSTSHFPHLHCSGSRTPAAGLGRNIPQSGRLLNIPPAAAMNQLGETRAVESLLGRSQLPVALDPGNP